MLTGRRWTVRAVLDRGGQRVFGRGGVDAADIVKMPTGLLGERGTVNPVGFCTLTLCGQRMCANGANSGTTGL